MTEAVLRLELYHAVDQVLRLLAHYLVDGVGRWPLDVAIFDILVNSMRHRSLEGHAACEHLEEDVAEGPCVDRQALLLLIDHLWRLVVNSADKSASSQ